MGIEVVVSQWGDAIDATLRERLPDLDVVSVPRGVPRRLPNRPCALLAMPIKAELPFARRALRVATERSRE